MPVRELKDFLRENGVPYEILRHDPTFTAQETAAAVHVPGKEFAKTVMIKVDGELAMAVVPASALVSLRRLKEASGGEHVTLADEEEFRDRFPGVEAGAMPPFGNLWEMPVYVDTELRDDDEIVFNAGSHTELMRIPYADFERLVRPEVARIAVRP
ncbi:MAG: YbaK/EbsC family protein [Gemmatimonadota bacterium]|jgi:Ala-tRNA(Pro) deacylase